MEYRGLKTNGLLVTLEGTDGCGKTSTLKHLKAMIAKTDIPVVYTKEPAGTKTGAKVRQILLDPHKHLSKIQQAKLFLIARQSHLEQVILPAIKAKKLIICDRYVLSNMAYQGDYRYLHHQLADINQILTRNVALPEFIVPNLNIYLQAELQTNEKRLKHRKQKSDKFDQSLEDIKNLKALRKQYHLGMQEMEARICTPSLLVNANRTPEERARFIYSNLLNLVKGVPD